MIDFDIYGDGRIIKINHREFIERLLIFSNLCNQSINSLVVNHVSGLADFHEGLERDYAQRLLRQYQTIVKGLTDNELGETLDNLENLLKELLKKDDLINVAYENAIYETRKSKIPIKNLKREVSMYLFKKNLPYPPRVLEIARETKKILPDIAFFGEKANIRIEQLLKEMLD